MLATTSIVATVPSNVQLATTSPSCRPSHAGAPAREGGGFSCLMSILKKCPCPMSI